MTRTVIGRKYPLHIDISFLQRSILAFGSSILSLTNPERGDAIAIMNETSAPISLLKHLKERMESDVEGRELLRIKPRINNQNIDRKWLGSLPQGTFGREYSNFLEQLHTSPDARPPVQYIDDPDLVYIMQRYRETHDFIHVILQMRPNMLGEVTVKYFEAIQLGFPMCIVASIFGGLRLLPKHRHKLITANLPWIVKQAKNARFLLALHWENYWEQDISQLQADNSIQPLNQTERN